MTLVCLGCQFFTGFIDDTTHSLAWACTAGDPVFGAVELDVEILAFDFRVVFADDFDEFAVTWAALVGNNDGVIRVIFGAFAAESDCYCHSNIFLSLGLKVSFELNWLVNF